MVGQWFDGYAEFHLSVSISSPSSEGGGLKLLAPKTVGALFPLVLLQAKVVGQGC